MDPTQKYKQIYELTVDIPSTIIKAILYESKLYALDLNGNVGIHIGGSGKGFEKVMEHCTDIILTDSIFAEQFSVNE